MTKVTGVMNSDKKARTGLLAQMWNHRADYLYVMPAIIVMLIVIAYPIYYTVDLSFYKTPPGLQLRDKIFVGLDNYAAILRSDVFWRVTLNTVVWTVASTFFAFVLGFGSALALHRDFLGRGIFRAILIDPVGDQRRGCLLHLEMDLSFGLWHHRLGRDGDGPYRPAAELHRQRQHGPAFADRGQCLARVSVCHDHDDGRAADRARTAFARGASRWRLGLAAVLAHHRPTPQRRVHGDDPASGGRELQFLRDPVDHDRWRPSNASHIWITHIYELAFGRQLWGVASAYSVLLFLVLMSFGYFYVRALSGNDNRESGA